MSKMISRRTFAAVALLCALTMPAHAQETKSALTTEVNTNWPDNSVGAITPALLRSTVLDVINSYYDLNGGTSLACAAHTWISALPTLSSITCTQPAFSDVSGQAALTQLPTLGTNTALCSIAGGTPIACTKTQITTLINLATSSLSGALPAFPGNTTTFFRGDGTYATLNVGAIGGFGTGVATALGVSVGSSGAPVLFNGAGGTPSSLTLTNATGLPFAGLPAGTQDTVLGYWTSTVMSATAMPNCTVALTYSNTTHMFGCNSSAGTGTVTSVQISAGADISVSTTSGNNPCTTTCNLTISNSFSTTSLQASPSNPTGTTSATGVMMGVGATCHITPAFSGRVNINFIGNVRSNGATSTATLKIYYGTGTAPTNGAATTGTQIGPSVVSDEMGTASLHAVYNNGGIITGLTPGTAYWFDINLATSGGNTGIVENNACSAFEF